MKCISSLHDWVFAIVNCKRRPNACYSFSSILLHQSHHRFTHSRPIFPRHPPLILLPPPPTLDTRKETRHRLIRTPNLHLTKECLHTITFLIRARRLHFLSVIVTFGASEHIFCGFVCKVFSFVVRLREREGVGAGATGEVVRGCSGGIVGYAGYGEHVGAGGTDWGWVSRHYGVC